MGGRALRIDEPPLPHSSTTGSAGRLCGSGSSRLNRIEAQFTALRYFALDGTDHRTHQEQGSVIRQYIIWRNHHAEDQQLRRIVNRANVA